MRHGDNAGARELLSTINLRKANKDVVRNCLNLSGQLHDRAGETTEAVKDFRDSQAGLPGMLPKLESLPPEAAAAVWRRGQRLGQAPILLVGVPGSGVERIAALLSDQSEVILLRDRIQGVRERRFRHGDGGGARRRHPGRNDRRATRGLPGAAARTRHRSGRVRWSTGFRASMRIT